MCIINTVKTEFMFIGTSQRVKKFDHASVTKAYMILTGADCEINGVSFVK